MAKGKYAEWLHPDKLLQLTGWARDGLTDVQIAHNMGINVATLYRWKSDHGAIREAIKEGKKPVDLMVENAMLKHALGYSYDEVTTEVYKRDGKTETHRKVTTKHVPPNTASGIYWLNNRCRDKWRQRPDRAEQAEPDDKLDSVLNGLLE